LLPIGGVGQLGLYQICKFADCHDSY